jgi:hypothetical protein
MYARAMPAIAYAKRTKAKPRLRLITKKYTKSRDERYSRIEWPFGRRKVETA